MADDGESSKSGKGGRSGNFADVNQQRKKAKQDAAAAAAAPPINTEDTIAKLEAEVRELKKAAEREKNHREQLQRELDHRKRTTDPPSAFRAGPAAQDSTYMDASGKPKKFKGPEDRKGYFRFRSEELTKIGKNILQVMLLMYALSFIPAQYTVNHISVSTSRGEAYEFAPVYYQYILYASFVFLNTIHKLIF